MDACMHESPEGRFRCAQQPVRWWRTQVHPHGGVEGKASELLEGGGAYMRHIEIKTLCLLLKWVNEIKTGASSQFEVLPRSSGLKHFYSVLFIRIELLYCVGEGNGNPLQYSCLENSVERGAWWAAVYGVAQSQTRLKRLSMHACIGEGNGNPLQYSCLENPRDRGAWWAVVYGVAQSQTRLKRLSSSSSFTMLCQFLLYDNVTRGLPPNPQPITLTHHS